MLTIVDDAHVLEQRRSDSLLRAAFCREFGCVLRPRSVGSGTIELIVWRSGSFPLPIPNPSLAYCGRRNNVVEPALCR